MPRLKAGAVTRTARLREGPAAFCASGQMLVRQFLAKALND